MQNKVGIMLNLKKILTFTFNIQHSAEAEDMTADKVAVPMIWARNFLEKQRYTLQENILFQDN